MEENYLKKLAESFAFFGILHDDLQNAKAYLNSNDSQFARRTYIRTLFAFIEGNSFRLRQLALSAHNHRTSCFTNEEIVMLEEKNISVKSNGEVHVGSKYLDFQTGFKFTLSAYAKAFDSSPPDYSESGWTKLIEVQKIRNRITHPKSKEDFDISDPELQTIDCAKEWYSKNIQFLLEGYT